MSLNIARSYGKVAILWKSTVAESLLCSEEGVSETNAFSRKKWTVLDYFLSLPFEKLYFTLI